MRRDFLIILTRIALSSNEKIQLVHIHTQNLYPTTHRPPADIRLHKTMIMKASSKEYRYETAGLYFVSLFQNAFTFLINSLNHSGLSVKGE